MTNSSNIGMLINHGEINHLLTNMSDSIRNAAYKVATQIAPKGSDKYDEYFDEDGTLKGYDEDSNKAILRDSLDHYVHYSNAYGSIERMDFFYYLETNFQMVKDYIVSQPNMLSYLTSLFATACGILASALQPVIEDIYSRGQMVDHIESYVTGPENTYYLVYGDDIDSTDTYDPKEDDLSSVVLDDTPEELAKWESKKDHIRATEAFSDQNRVIEPIPYHPHIDSEQYAKLNRVDTRDIDNAIGLNLVWHAPGTEPL